MSCPVCGEDCDGARHFSNPTSGSLAGSLARRVVPIVDRVRDLRVRLGFKQYEVAILRASWSGGRRGVGVAQVVHSLQILPVPKVTDITSLAEIASPVGIVESGSILISEISGEYDEDTLLGKDATGVDPEVEVFYEVAFTRRDGTPGERRRFTPSSAPFYDPDRYQWSLRLEKAIQNRTRSGDMH